MYPTFVCVYISEDEESDEAGLGSTPPVWMSLALWSITATLLAMPFTLGIHWAIYYILAAPSHGLGKVATSSGFGEDIDRTAAGACVHHLQLFLKKLLKPCWKKKASRSVKRISLVQMTAVYNASFDICGETYMCMHVCFSFFFFYVSSTVNISHNTRYLKIYRTRSGRRSLRRKVSCYVVSQATIA